MTIDEFEKCILRLLSLARSRGVVKIDTGSRDYYWNVPAPAWVDMTKEPKLAVGSLDDDVAELSKLLDEPDRASAVDLDRAAAVLHLISDDLSSLKDPPV